MAWGERQGRPSDYSAFAIADCGHSIPDLASLNPGYSLRITGRRRPIRGGGAVVFESESARRQIR